jgi:hypothetical protein
MMRRRGFALGRTQSTNTLRLRSSARNPTSKFFCHEFGTGVRRAAVRLGSLRPCSGITYSLDSIWRLRFVAFDMPVPLAELSTLVTAGQPFPIESLPNCRLPWGEMNCVLLRIPCIQVMLSK